MGRGSGTPAQCFTSLQGYCFGVMGQRLSRRVRTVLLHAMLRMEVGWFDRPENTSGALGSCLRWAAG